MRSLRAVPGRLAHVWGRTDLQSVLLGRTDCKSVLRPVRTAFVNYPSLFIATLFLLCRKSFEALPVGDWKTLKVSAVLYFATVLSVFGEFSVMSDLVYYLVPQVGLSRTRRAPGLHERDQRQ